MSSHDAKEMLRLSIEVDRLETTVKQLTERNEELQGELAELELAASWRDEDEGFDLIADHKRGLISTDELYERTVGR